MKNISKNTFSALAYQAEVGFLSMKPYFKREVGHGSLFTVWNIEPSLQVSKDELGTKN